LPERPSHVLGEDARQHVGGPAGGERHDQRDRPRWKVLRLRRNWPRRRHRPNRCLDEIAPLHEHSPWSFLFI
jgi:hypothetical protein